ncbi:NHL repeat-containing protein [Mesorhizobium sp.]|uniref:NHL repeat-containing protein n=1 Tax=Mesorhizobium sp. TaxID=1871066 RepID=UPI000FE5FFAA|nr:NHL repeat-containing protein [Mesorhizobium sp.]RWP37995.1 MAG: 6-bladed beta-propeller [Mesorhizobium sp.]
MVRNKFCRIVIFVFFGVLYPGSVLAGDPFDSKYPNIVAPTAEFGRFGISLGEFNEPSAVRISKDEKIYIADCYNRRVQVVDRDGKSLFSFAGSEEFPLTCPQGLAISDEFVFVSDRRGYVVKFTLEGDAVAKFGEHGSAQGQLMDPHSIAAFEDLIFVADSGNDRITIFRHDGAFKGSFGALGDGQGTFQNPTGITIDIAGLLYVVDNLNRVQKFTRDGKLLKSWGTYGSFSGQFAEPSDIDYSRGRLYVSDLLNHRLQVFNTQGSFLLQWGRHPEKEHQGQGHTHYPSSIAVSPDEGFVVVCEQFEYRCQLFDTDKLRNLASVDVNAWWEKFPQFHYGGGARILRRAAMPSDVLDTLDQAGAFDLMIMTEPDLHRAVLFGIPQDPTLDADSLTVYGTIGKFGNGPGQFSMMSLKQMSAIEKEIYIGDAGNNNIQVFDLETLDYERTMFKPGDGPGEFNGPAAMEFGKDGRIYIADFHNNRIQVFDKEWKYLSEFGGLGDAPGKLFGPLSIAFSQDKDRLYVTDTGNQRVNVYDPNGNLISTIGHLTKPGEWGEGTFQWPFDVAVAPSGDIYVTDPSLQLVQRFDPTGEFVSQWGGWGTMPGQFYKCKGIDIDSQGRVFVIDFGNHRGQVFDRDGKFLAIFGEGLLYPAKDLDAQGKPKDK